MIDGTVQETEFKGRDSFEFKPISAHWFASNHLPSSKDYSQGFTRRWLILEFNREVATQDRISDFHQVLVAEEREAIAAWAVQGLTRLQSQKDYTQPASHIARVNQVARANNSVLSWLESNEKVRPTDNLEDTADAGEAYREYSLYMREYVHTYPAPYEKFLQMMDDLGYRRGDYRDVMNVLRVKFHNLRIKSIAERLAANAV